jgi:sulfite reductase alpha subunit-like flavoprotein
MVGRLVTAANPFPARIHANRELHTALSPRSARHIEFDLTGSGIQYVTTSPFE